MKLKKIYPELASAIIDAGFDKNPKEVQSLTIPKVKSGADIIAIAPEGEGKSTAILMGVIQRLKKAEGDAPRAIIMVQTKEDAFAMEEQFDLLAKNTDLRVFTVFDQGIIQYQKDMIYEGLDVLIGTPRRLGDLVSTTGIPMVSVQIFAVDDAELLFPVRNQHIVYRLGDSIERSQFLIFANKWTDKFNEVDERLLKNPHIIQVEATVEDENSEPIDEGENAVEVENDEKE